MTRERSPLDFSSRRALAPMLWTLLAIASCELMVAHLLIALWSPTVAAGVSIVSVVTLVWLVGAIRSLATAPSRIEGERLILRTGRLRHVTVALSQIAGIRGEPLRAEVKAGQVLNLALIAHPNVMIDLKSTISHRGRSIRTLAHRFDDPTGFLAAWEAARAADLNQ